VTTEVGSPDIAATSSTRRFYLYSAVVAIAATIAVFGKVILYMVDHWRAVPDYSHGFVVAPLALYFAWERRRQLARAPIA